MALLARIAATYYLLRVLAGSTARLPTYVGVIQRQITKGIDMQMTASRRSFVKGAALGVAGVAASMGISRSARADETDFAASYDVVVVGAGGAGLFAALEAQEQGLSVIVLESEENVMPNTTFSEGYVTPCETEMQPAGREQLYEDLLAASDYDCQEDLVQAYVDNAGEVYTKLVETVGVEFERLDQVAHQSVPWTHYCVSGAYIIQPLLEILEGRGVEVLTSSRVTRLVQDADRRVVGVMLEDGTTAYGANKGVVLATGDFTRNPALIKNFGSRGSERIVPKSSMGNRGDGHIMGMFAGADTSYMCAGIAPTGTIGVQSGDWATTFLQCSCMVVSMEGRRFHDESDNYVGIMQDAMALDSDITFQILDAGDLKDYLDTCVISATKEPMISADTIEGLADAIKAEYPDFNVENFLDEHARYNRFIANGLDEDFGRAHIVGIVGDLSPIDEAPFYAIPCRLGADHFSSGLKIDPECHVIDMFGDQIPGLYAAGMVAGGLSSWNYMSGTCVGRALIQGMVAARAIAGE